MNTISKAEEVFRQMYTQGATYEEIGAFLGVTRQRAEQLRRIYKIPSLNREDRYRLRHVEISSKEQKARHMYHAARVRAYRCGCNFDIEVFHIATPDKCPIFGYELNYENEGLQFNSPSLDRLEPLLGYIPSNIITLSHRANTLKNNGSIKEFELIISFLKSKGKLCHSL